MFNALNTKILLAILVLVAAIAADVAWRTRTEKAAREKVEEQRKAFWNKLDSDRKTQPHYTFNPAGH